MSDSDIASIVQEYAEQFAVTKGPIEHHAAEALFNGLPRWSGSKPDVQLDSLGNYIMEVALSALVPAIAAFIVLLVCFVLLVVRHSCLSEKVDKRLVRRRKREGKDKLPHLVCSTILIHATLIFLSLGAIGTIVVCEAAESVANIVTGLLQEISLAGLALMDFIIWIENQFENFDPSPLDDGTRTGEFMVLAFTTVVEYVPERFPKVAGFKSELAKFLSSLVSFVDRIGDAIEGIFVGCVVFGLLTLTALGVAFCTGMFTKKRICFRAMLHLFFLLFPLFISWLLLAFVTGAGVGLADGCQMVAEYRSFITTGTFKNTSRNFLVENGGLVCPSKAESEKLEAEMEATAGVVLDNPLASSTLVMILNSTTVNEANPSIEEDDLSETTKWALEETRGYINCDILNQFAGRIENQLCGHWKTSLIAGVYYLWISNLMTSILLSTLLIGSIFGAPVLWAAAVWALPEMHQTIGVHASDSEGGRKSSNPDEEMGDAANVE